jgi:hypothetical protein
LRRIAPAKGTIAAGEDDRSFGASASISTLTSLAQNAETAYGADATLYRIGSIAGVDFRD